MINWKPASELPKKAGRYLGIWKDKPDSKDYNLEMVNYDPTCSPGCVWQYHYDYMSENITDKLEWWAIVPVPEGVKLWSDE